MHPDIYNGNLSINVSANGKPLIRFIGKLTDWEICASLIVSQWSITLNVNVCNVCWNCINISFGFLWSSVEESLHISSSVTNMTHTKYINHITNKTLLYSEVITVITMVWCTHLLCMYISKQPHLQLKYICLTMVQFHPSRTSLHDNFNTVLFEMNKWNTSKYASILNIHFHIKQMTDTKKSNALLF